ncbi:hypothetical protein V1292_003231 [Bradyrhizobium sp. AZCC 1719]|uniref:hypothetical protein n=1 Tax=Bradyrhizobium sp. AZCC 1719 TaxID=3117028 RepID=UPI002FF35B2B
MRNRPKIIVVNRSPPAKRSKIDIALISLGLSILTSAAGAGWAFFNYADTRQQHVQQTQSQWQQEISGLIKEVYNNESASTGTETARSVQGARRSVLIQQIEAALKEGKQQKFNQPPEVLSILGFTYAGAGHVELAAEHWRQVADSETVALAVRLPAAMALRRFTLEGRSPSSSEKISEERLNRLIDLVSTNDRQPAVYTLVQWATTEISFRNFDKAIALLERASKSAGSAECNPGLRREMRTNILSIACTLESKNKQGVLSVLKGLYQISPEDKNWCPSDRSLADLELTCDNLRGKEMLTAPGIFPTIEARPNAGSSLQN